MLLSGHTHGGQLFPLAYINTSISRNDMVYGFEQKGNTSFIVSSGISEWGFGFRTGCRSEYVVIDVESAESWELIVNDKTEELFLESYI